MAGLFTFRDFWPEICIEAVAEKLFFSYFVLMPDLGYEPGLYAQYYQEIGMYI